MTYLMDPYLKSFWTEALVWINALLFVLLPNNSVGCNYSTAIAKLSRSSLKNKLEQIIVFLFLT